jgi:hypothetical protein
LSESEVDREEERKDCHENDGKREDEKEEMEKEEEEKKKKKSNRERKEKREFMFMKKLSIGRNGKKSKVRVVEVEKTFTMNNEME